MANENQVTAQMDEHESLLSDFARELDDIITTLDRKLVETKNEFEEAKAFIQSLVRTNDITGAGKLNIAIR
jgi:hypothetical protein